MFVVKRSLAGSLICTLVSFSCFSAVANDVGKELQQRTELQTAEVNMLRAQLELESWTFSQVKDLHSKGFASWLELQRKQLNVDAVQARLNSAIEFQDFLKRVTAENQATSGDNLVALRDRTSKPIKVFVPGSVRLIGWIEGQGLAELKADDAGLQQLAAAGKKLAEAQRRSAVLTDSPSTNSHHRKIALLRLNLATAEFEHTNLFHQVYSQSTIDAGEMSVSLENLKQFVTADQNPELSIATSNVASAETAATGHINLAKSMLERQQRRVEALRKLQKHGVASPKEVETATTQLSDIQSQLDAFSKNQEILRQAVTIESGAKLAPAEYQPVSNWPAVVMNDNEFALHLIDLRLKYHEEQANKIIAENRIELLKQVLPRLKEAALSSASVKSQFQSTLQEGQLNEIKAYESEIEIVEAAAVSSVEKQHILVREEARLILQAVTQYEAARDSLAAADNSSATALGLFSLITSPVGMLVGNDPKVVALRFSYLESGATFDLNASNSLLYSYRNLDFVGAPYAESSRNRIRLRPAKNLMLASDSLQSNSTARGLTLEPDWMNYFRQNYERNAFSTLPYGVRSYTSYYPSPNYGFGSDRSIGTYSAYPYGILRPELRSRVTPGQLPWYLPGSPSNIRRNQLPYNYGSRNYRKR